MAKRKTSNKDEQVTTNSVEETKKVEPIKFSKGQLIKSKKYANRRDALNALLKDDKAYTFEQVDEIFKQFYEGGHE